MSAATVAPDPAPDPVRARLVPLGEPPARALQVPGLPAGPPPAAGSVAALGRDPAVSPPSPPAEPVRLPDPTRICCDMVQAAVEALGGSRPLAQLARWVSPEIFDQLAARSEVTQRVLGRGPATRHAAIRRIRLCRLGEHTAEATVVVDDGPRVRAVAVRLENHRGHWRATALEIG